MTGTETTGLPHNAAWRTSTRSSATNCVEVAGFDGGVAVRDSKDRGGPVLLFAQRQWRDFVAAAKGGEFDRA
jgi:hypothetical protein